MHINKILATVASPEIREHILKQYCAEFFAHRSAGKSYFAALWAAEDSAQFRADSVNGNY